MELGCLFPPGLRTPAHIEQAEALGYRRAYVYDSRPSWPTRGSRWPSPAGRTTRIALGVCAITPRLRHVVATAGALATLAGLAPGRPRPCSAPGSPASSCWRSGPPGGPRSSPTRRRCGRCWPAMRPSGRAGSSASSTARGPGCQAGHDPCGSPRTARVGTRPRPGSGRHRHQPLPPRRQPGAPGHEPGPGAVLRHGAGPRGGPGQRAGP